MNNTVEGMKMGLTTLMTYVLHCQEMGVNFLQEMKVRSTPMLNYVLQGGGGAQYWKETENNTLIITLKEKLQESVLGLEKFSGYLVGSFDEIFPPGTREEQIRRWFHLAKPYLIAAAAVYFLFKICRRGGGGGGVKTMKAPGRNARIQRSRFEANPRGYFRDLRGK